MALLHHAVQVYHLHPQAHLGGVEGGGARPPILLGSDGPGLRSALQAAFRIETGPLVLLLEEASERALDLMLVVAGSESSS